MVVSEVISIATKGFGDILDITPPVQGSWKSRR